MPNQEMGTKVETARSGDSQGRNTQNVLGLRWAQKRISNMQGSQFAWRASLFFLFMAFGLYTLKIIQPSVTSCLRDGQSIAEEPAYYIISLSMYLSLSRSFLTQGSC